METDATIPLSTEVSIVIRNGGDDLRARARVARTNPGAGLALEFTEIEGEHFHILEYWLATHLTATWVNEDRGKTGRVLMRTGVRVSGYDTSGQRFTETTFTVEISELGGSVILKVPVRRGQRLVLTNLRSKKSAECMVVHIESRSAEPKVGLAFIGVHRSFWPVEFPPA